jgi:hypothetical protein
MWKNKPKEIPAVYDIAKYDFSYYDTAQAGEGQITNKTKS